MESPFIPPELKDEADIVESYPDSVKNLLGDSNLKKIVFGASRFNRDSSGRDLYGLTDAVRLVSRIAPLDSSVRMVIAMAEFNLVDIPVDIVNEIRCLEERGLVMTLFGQYELWPAIRRANLFLRLTSTDGESVSVIEALHFGCTAICSDVVERPQGAVIYKYGDFDNLVEVVASNI
ncbi:hypothetical protein ACU4GI_21975 [Cupriavidus basilensis]